jgi:hypothetical protein
MKGGLAPGFKIPFADQRKRTFESVKYLKIHIDTDIKFKQQKVNILKNSSDLFRRMIVANGQSWGYNTYVKTCLYRSIYLPRISYGSMFWSYEVKTKKDIF